MKHSCYAIDMRYRKNNIIILIMDIKSQMKNLRQRVEQVPQFKQYNLDFEALYKMVKLIETKYPNQQGAPINQKVQQDYVTLKPKCDDEDSYNQALEYFLNYKGVSPYVNNLNQQSVVLKINKRSIYFGELQNGLRHGKGIFIHESGKMYEGSFQNNFMHGKGFMVLSNGANYHGMFVNSKPEGQGSFLWPNGERYLGQWVNGLKQGVGLWKGGKSDFYVGQWWSGLASGFGWHSWVNGDNESYLGELKESLKHGYGIEQFANGDCYQGNYLNGRPCGFGEYLWANGARYKGNFQNGLRFGKGVYIRSTDQYQGEYLNDKKNGYGVQVWQNGTRYSGQFRDDKRNGYGEMQWVDGTAYKGEWYNGKLHGEGSMTKGDMVITGTWNQNQYLQEIDTEFNHIDSVSTSTNNGKIGTRIQVGRSLTKHNRDMSSDVSQSHDLPIIQRSYSPVQLRHKIKPKLNSSVSKPFQTQYNQGFSSHPNSPMSQNQPKPPTKTKTRAWIPSGAISNSVSPVTTSWRLKTTKF